MIDFKPGKLSLLNKMKIDFSGFLFYRLYYLLITSNEFFYTQLYRALLRFKKVNLGIGCRFSGKSLFVRFPLSNITIGSYCTFRSDQISNLIGVNRRCIIATHSENAQIIIGEGCGLSGVTIGAYEKIILGDNILCGANVLITDFDWHTSRYPSESKPVIIHDNVWIGVNSVLLKGVEIGENSIIGANSVVVKNIPANVVAAGNPCKVIKKLNFNE